MDKTEKERRKHLQSKVKQKNKFDFENSLPMARENFIALFNYLDVELSERGCKHSSELTENFLNNIKISNIETILNWIADNGGYCDCEILANVEDLFE